MFEFLKTKSGDKRGRTSGEKSAAGVVYARPDSGVDQNAEQLLRLALAKSGEGGRPSLKSIELRLALSDLLRMRAAEEEDPALLEEAALQSRKAMELSSAGFPKPVHLSSMRMLALVLADQQKWETLERVELDALRLTGGLKQSDPAEESAHLFRLALARKHLGKKFDVETTMAKCIELQEQATGPEDLDTAETLFRAGSVLRMQGSHTIAQQYLNRSLAIYQAEYGTDAAQTYPVLQQLATSLEESGDTEQAAHHYERALQSKLRRTGLTNLEEVAELQYRLANLYAGWGNVTRARELLAECIGAFQGKKGPRLAVAYELMAQVQESAGLYPLAVKELQNAAKLWRGMGVERKQELARNLQYTADLLEPLRRGKEADWLREEAAELLGLEPLKSTSSIAYATKAQLRSLPQNRILVRTGW